jgi:hypothetical protein
MSVFFPYITESSFVPSFSVAGVPHEARAVHQDYRQQDHLYSRPRYQLDSPVSLGFHTFSYARS